jgi:hypothetical protein
MNDEEKRIAIAEACGWKKCEGENGLSPYGIYTVLPDYLNDLNAMHKAEKMLSSIQQTNYISLLAGITCDVEMEGVTFATAAQRAEAFLKTIGKL